MRFIIRYVLTISPAKLAIFRLFPFISFYFDHQETLLPMGYAVTEEGKIAFARVVWKDVA